jgi:hypothetical protein
MADAKLFSWNWKDAGKAAIMLVITTVATAVLQIIESGSFPTLDQLKTALIVGATAGVSYLIKNFLSNSDGQFLTKEKP